MILTDALPSAEDVERAVLACYLIEPGNLDRVPLSEEHFQAPANRTVFRAMAHLRAEGEQLDILTVRSLLESSGELGRVGGVGYIASLDNELPDLSRVEDYAKILEDRRMRRRLIVAAAALDRVARDAGTTPAEAIGLHQGELGRLQNDRTGGVFAPIGGVLNGMAAEFSTMQPGTSVGIATGFSDLDDITNGMLPGQLWLVAGRPGMGKTALCLNIAAHQSLQHGVPAAMFSLEMTTHEVSCRLLAAGTQIPSQKFRHGHASTGERAVLRQYAAGRASAPFRISDKGHATAGEIVATARAFAARQELRVLYIDHLGFVSATRGDSRRTIESRNSELEEIAHALKAVAKELGITVVALSQLNRSCERRGADKRPILSDLRDSGATEQDADLVLFIYRDDLYAPKNEARDMAEIIVAKNRDGATGYVQLEYTKDTTTFRSVARHS